MPIFDQGYQHWKGELTGHGWRWLAVARHGVRAQIHGRFTRLMLGIAWLPAIALVLVLTVWGLLEQQAESVITFLQRLLPPEVISQPRDYRTAVWTIAYSYFFKAELICSLFLVLLVGPNLVSRDLRFNAFPLYFSRPLRRIDYFLGKLGVIGFFLAATLVVPAVGAYLLGLAFSLDLGVIRDTHRLLWSGILYGLVITLSAGTLMLALSSLSRRSIYVGLAWAGFVFLSGMISSVIIGVNGDTDRRAMIQEGMQRWLEANPPPPGVEMRGIFPLFRGPQKSEKLDQKFQQEEKRRQQWLKEWSQEYGDLNSDAESIRLAQGYTDWRPVLSYVTNLDRMGDVLLDTDNAWVVLGRTIERPRQMIRGGGGRERPPNDRRLADRQAWQYPWYWSGGTLAGLWLFSVFVLSRRVKSLDRLK